MEKPIYLDYNATTPVDSEVVDELIPYIREHYGNPSGSYSIGRSNKEAIELARMRVARLINARPNEIIFTGCATESNNLAIRGAAIANQSKGKHIITSAIEHPAVLEVCKHLAAIGFKISYVPVDSRGVVNPDDVEMAIRPDTILISIMHANNEVGAIQPVKEIAALARQHHILVHTDAAQSAGKIDADVEKLGVDLLTIAGHKIYAPKGIGALYVTEGTPIEKIMYGGGQENGLRPGTENVPYIVALGKACEIALRDFDKNVNAMLSTKMRLLDGLKSKLGSRVRVNSEGADILPNTLSVAFDGIDSHTLASLVGNDVLISSGSACHSDSIEVSPVLKAMNVDVATAAATVRISTGKHTTRQEIDKAVETISRVVSKF